MITLYELVLIGLEGTSTHTFNPSDGWQVYKRQNYVEVIYKNEQTKNYSVSCYPWHTVQKLNSYGVLERKGN
jgi:hypothetical protein